jgi:hypothetical protein
MSSSFNTEKEIDRKIPKISHLEIPRFEKSLKLCPKIVLCGFLFIKDIQQYKTISTNQLTKCS